MAETSPYGRVTGDKTRGPTPAQKAIKVTLILIAVVIGLTLLPGILRGFAGSSQALKSRAGGFLEAYQFKDYRILYSYLSSQHQQRLTLDEFEKSMSSSGIPGLRISASTEIRIEDVRKSGSYEGSVKVKFIDSNWGRERIQNRTFYWVLENDNQWYYDRISD